MNIRERLIQIANDLPEGMVNSFQVKTSAVTITKDENYEKGTEQVTVNIDLVLS